MQAQADDDSDHNVEFASGNVQVITTKESWDQKLEQARRDSKIVSFASYLICCSIILKVIGRPVTILFVLFCWTLINLPCMYVVGNMS